MNISVKYALFFNIIQSTEYDKESDNDGGMLPGTLERVCIPGDTVRHPPNLTFSPFHLIQPGLVSPSLEQDRADGSEEEDVGDLDEQDEDVHVDELC